MSRNEGLPALLDDRPQLQRRSERRAYSHTVVLLACIALAVACKDKSDTDTDTESSTTLEIHCRSVESSVQTADCSAWFETVDGLVYETKSLKPGGSDTASASTSKEFTAAGASVSTQCKDSTGMPILSSDRKMVAVSEGGTTVYSCTVEVACYFARMECEGPE